MNELSYHVSLNLSALDPNASTCLSIWSPDYAVAVLSVIYPFTLVVWAIRPAISSMTMLFIFHVVSLIPATFWKDEMSLAVLLVMLEFSCVFVATRKRDGAKSVHLVIEPVAFVGASLGEPRQTMAVLLSLMVIAFVVKFWHCRFQSYCRRRFGKIDHCNWIMNRLQTAD